MSIRKALTLAGLALALAALSPAAALSAKQKKTYTVDGTMKIAIIEHSATANHFAGRYTGKPEGPFAVLGVAGITNTPTGLVTESRSTLYGKKGTQRFKATDVVEFQPDGSIKLTGTYKVTGGSGKYRGATGRGTFNGALPPGSTLDVGTVVTFDVDGKIRY